MRASAAALGPEPQPRRKAIVSAAAPAAVTVVKKQSSYLEEDGDQVGSGLRVLFGTCLRSLKAHEGPWAGLVSRDTHVIFPRSHP